MLGGDFRSPIKVSPANISGTVAGPPANISPGGTHRGVQPIRAHPCGAPPPMDLDIDAGTVPDMGMLPPLPTLPPDNFAPGTAAGPPISQPLSTSSSFDTLSPGSSFGSVSSLGSVGSANSLNSVGSGSPSGSPTSPSTLAPRRRGRPRKGEEMSEEERKARRKEINRLAARRAHQKKLGLLSKLQTDNTALKEQLQTTNNQIRQYESILSYCGVDVEQLGVLAVAPAAQGMALQPQHAAPLGLTATAQAVLPNET